MLIRLVKMTFRPEEVPTFLENFNANKHKIRAFEGCQYLEVWQDQQQLGIFFSHSHWKDAAALEAYRKSELFRGIWAKTKVLFAQKPEAWSLSQQALLP